MALGNPLVGGGVGIVMQLVMTLIMILLSGALLLLTTKLFKLKDAAFKTALKIAAILGGINFVVGVIMGLLGSPAAVFAVGILVALALLVLSVILVKKEYGLQWGKALLVWLVWMIFTFVAYMILAFILAAIFVAVGIGALAGGLAGQGLA